MKKILFFIIVLFIFFINDTKILGDTMYNIYDKYANKHNYKLISNKNLLKTNIYHNEVLSSSIKEIDKDVINNKQELVNKYFTAINKGYDYITFYCSNDYELCMDDLTNIDKENNNFSVINQLVNTYNTYSSIESTYYSNGRVDLKINKKYSQDDIVKIDNRLNEIINELEINNYPDVKDKIKIFHDYIANNNTYDRTRAEQGESEYHSDSALGALFEGHAICSGYTDIMSIFLNKIKVKNVKIATNNHVWNGIYIDNKWYHLDLTWDDPVVSDGSNMIIYDYFLIDDKELDEKNDNEHEYDKNAYDFIK